MGAGDEEDKDREIWLLKFSKSSAEKRLSKAPSYLVPHDILDRATRGGEWRSDHAPKSRLQKGLEASIEGTIGRRNRAHNA